VCKDRLGDSHHAPSVTGATGMSLFEIVFEKQRTEKSARYNKGKKPYGLVPPEFPDWLTDNFQRGAVKYEANNWKNSINTEDHDQFMYDRLESAMRHIQRIRYGERFDAETIEGAEDIKVAHAVCAAWNLLVYEYYEYMRGNHA